MTNETNENDNILQFRKPAPPPDAPREPFFGGMPPVTKIMVGLIILIHAIVAFTLTPPQTYEIYESFGFVPARYSGAMPFNWTALLAPFTYNFLHGSWAHVLINAATLAAFGAGLERAIGGRRLLILFFLCSLAALFAQFILAPTADGPVIGASGGISGLFAAIILLMKRSGQGFGGRYGLLPFILLWLVLTVGFGQFAAPGGGSVAWAAHIGGFLAGFALLGPVMRLFH